MELDAPRDEMDNGFVRSAKLDVSAEAQGNAWAFVYLAPSLLAVFTCLFPHSFGCEC